MYTHGVRPCNITMTWKALLSISGRSVVSIVHLVAVSIRKNVNVGEKSSAGRNPGLFCVTVDSLFFFFCFLVLISLSEMALIPQAARPRVSYRLLIIAFASWSVLCFHFNFLFKYYFIDVVCKWRNKSSFGNCNSCLFHYCGLTTAMCHKCVVRLWC